METWNPSLKMGSRAKPPCAAPKQYGPKNMPITITPIPDNANVENLFNGRIDKLNLESFRHTERSPGSIPLGQLPMPEQFFNGKGLPVDGPGCDAGVVPLFETTCRNACRNAFRELHVGTQRTLRRDLFPLRRSLARSVGSGITNIIPSPTPPPQSQLTT